MGFFPGCGNTITVQMHQKVVNKMHGEKARWEMHKNAVSCFEQIREATPNNIAAVQPLTSHLKNQLRFTRNVRDCWRSKDKIISNVLVRIQIHGHAIVGWPARTYLHQLSVDTGCSLETCLKWWMIGTDGERKRVREI